MKVCRGGGGGKQGNGALVAPHGRGAKNPRPPPGPLLAQGVNLPGGVRAGRGLKAPLELSASSVQPETGSLDEVAGEGDPARSYTKKGTP